ncbi:MAG: recombination protein RecR [Elusimicrobia bacterium RIFOXYB2_FULL_49_7]|nr:MAG: recombination protein RecR [Elusimicrobia bacterium RIFOXYB2_FULL_49_7]
MEQVAAPLQELFDELAKLPSIGRKSAQRLAYHILRLPVEETVRLSDAIRIAREKIRECSVCFNYTETERCLICNSHYRNNRQICVVEKPSDIFAIERSGFYKGLYHVLGGALSPIDGMTPDKLKVRELLARVSGPEMEVILSTSTGTEGDHTAFYLAKLLREKGAKVTRLARGLPVGSELEYLDEITLLKAMEDRVSF